MSKKENHSAEPSKLTRFRSFEEMKAAPPLFPSSKSPEERFAEFKELFALLRSTMSTNNTHPSKKARKKFKK
jgi:hypothetical protein